MNQLVVITGASRGLGFETALQFNKNGWNTIGTGTSHRPTKLPDAIAYTKFDAANYEACVDFWKTITKKYRNAEVCLVNNAGGYFADEFAKTNSDDIYNMMSTNYFTAVNMTRAMVDFVSRARIINVISSTANAPEAKNAAYGASKAAEKYFFQALQQEFKPEVYQITNVYPRSIATHGPARHTITPADLATFILEQARNSSSYYVRDAVLFPN